jgi:hydroxymethylpyrimidine/phosphomethylpyrimidine kinase
LAEKFGVPVLVKGGHLPGAKRAVDVLFNGKQFREFAAPVIRNVKPHGAGCTFSAAIAANLALGYSLVESIGCAKSFVTKAIRDSIRLGKYRALNL